MASSASTRVSVGVRFPLRFTLWLTGRSSPYFGPVRLAGKFWAFLRVTPFRFGFPTHPGQLTAINDYAWLVSCALVSFLLWRQFPESMLRIIPTGTTSEAFPSRLTLNLLNFRKIHCWVVSM